MTGPFFFICSRKDESDKFGLNKIATRWLGKAVA